MKNFFPKISTFLILIFIPFFTNHLSDDESERVVECNPKLNSLWCSRIMSLSRNSFGFSEIPHAVQTLIIDCKDELVSFLPSDSFMNVKNLFDLLIINCPSLGLREKLYLPQQNLKYLRLQNNALTSVIIGKLKPSNSLTGLDLSFNKIKTLDFEFGTFPNLRVLSLMFNNIQNITSNAFKNCYRLTSVSLVFNSISSLVYKNEFGNITNIFDYKNVPNLQFLNLGHNKIFHLDFSMIPKNLATLSILNNPVFNFSCKKPHLRDYTLKELSVDWALLENSSICFPPSLEILTLKNIIIWRLPAKILSALVNFRKPQLKGKNFVFVVKRIVSYSSNSLRSGVKFFFKDICALDLFKNSSKTDKLISNNYNFPIQQIELIPVHNNNSAVYCQFIQMCSPAEYYDLQRKISLGKPDIVYFALSSRRDPVIDCGNLMLNEAPLSLPKYSRELYLDGNNMTSVNLQQILEDYSYLETLYLNASKIRRIEVKKMRQISWPLQELHLENNFLIFFPAKLLKYLRSLTSFHLQNNSLVEFNMKGVYSLYLDQLHLEYNNISTFLIEDSKTLVITNVYLQYNRISKIEKRFCSYLFKILYLDNNEISDVDLDCRNSKTSSELKKLFMRNNYLTVLKSFCFSTLKHLQELHLERNRIEHLEENCFYDLPELVKLFLQQNKLKYIGQKMLPVFKHAENHFLVLNIYKWFFNSHDLGIEEKSSNISKINKKSELLLDSVKIKSYFIEIDFQRNFIETMDLSIFNSFPFLVSLRLNNNRLREISCNQSLSLLVLKEIHLEENRLIRLNGGEFKGLTKVTKLYLHHNELIFIDKDTFKDMTSLEILTLHGNKFQRLEILQFGFSSNFKRLTIHENPISCECKYLEDFRDIFKTVSFISNVSEVKCLSTENKNYLLEDYLIRFCDNKQIIFGLSVLIGLLLLTGFLGVLLYKFRLEIQVIMYSRFKVRFFYDQAMDERKPFHAFIAYSGDDREFVAEELLPGLEKYRLCLHDRNFVVGAFIQENIVNAVNHSACTVVVFSTSFVKSPWCRFEFRTAHEKSLSKGCRPIIVILLEDVSPDDMKEEMKVYLRTSTYLRWGDQLFWEKLYFVLPALNRNDNQRNNQQQIPLQQFDC